MAFFDAYPLFYETSRTTPDRNRLGSRHRAIIAGNRPLIEGRRILDLASHDGRWSFAAVEAGCAHVTGIEARPHLVASANANFEAYGVPPSKYRFHLGDVFEVMRAEKPLADTVLVLGFFYHVVAHAALVSLIAATGAPVVILDTTIVPESEPGGELATVRLSEEPTGAEANAVGPGQMALVARPSRQAIRLLFGHYGYTEMREVDWKAVLTDTANVEDYAAGIRSTFILSRPAVASA